MCFDRYKNQNQFETKTYFCYTQKKLIETNSRRQAIL